VVISSRLVTGRAFQGHFFREWCFVSENLHSTLKGCAERSDTHGPFVTLALLAYNMFNEPMLSAL
jgi:hypothetical protein